MFLRKLYLNLIKILNHKSVIYYLNLFEFENLSISGSDVRNLDIFKKIYLCIFPNFYLENYNLFNENTVRLVNFRKKFLPNFSYRFETYISYDYNISCDQFFSQYFDFIKEEISEDFKSFNNLFKSSNEPFSLYLMFFFLKKHFYHFFSFNFFTGFGNYNLTKVFFFFSKIFFDKNFNNFPKLFFTNSEKYTNWFMLVKTLNSNFPEKKIFQESFDNILRPSKTKDLNEFSENIQKTLKDEIKPYVRLYSDACWALYDATTYRLIKTVFRVKISLNSLWDVFVESDFVKSVNSVLPYRYSDSSVNKFIDLSKLDNFIFFFLRKNKIFNKGRYSRNRQTYRTGFYWCLWLNIFVVYGLHFVFYRFTFTFGYLWLFLFIFFSSFIFSRALKYNLISYNSIISEIGEFINFLKFIFLNFFVFFKKLGQICFNFLAGLTNPSEGFSKIDLNVDDFYLDITFEEPFIKFFNKYSPVFEKEVILFVESLAGSVEIEFSKNFDEFYITEAHDLWSEMTEERILEQQRELIWKLRNEK
jgi:hypothetical protein